MQKSLEFSGKNEDEAVASALRQLNLGRDDVSIEIVERAKSGFLGIGATPAVIKVTFEAPDEEKQPAPKAEADNQRQTVRPVSKTEKKPAVGTQTQSKPVSVEGQPDDKKITDFLDGLLSHMGIKAEIAISSKEDGSAVIELSGDNMGAVIGRRGETLDAIQHLTNYSVNRGAENRRHISIDAESYRSKREDALVHLAEKMAEKALKYKRSMALEPMNSYERHIIHTALQDYEGVTTGSTGTEPNRRVVISCEKVKEQ